MISLDTETCAWVDRPGWKAPPLVCVSVSGGNTTTVVHRTDDWYSVVRAAFRDGMVGHNIAFDMAVLAAAGFPLVEIFDAYANDAITCTIAREKLLDIHTGDMATQRKPRGPGYSLEVLAKRRLGVELDKSTVRLRYEEMFNIPVAQWPEAFRIYAADDARYTLDLYHAQETAPGHPNLVDQYRQARGAFWIQLMSVWGTRVDLDELNRLKARYGDMFTAAGRDLVANGLAREQKGKLVRNVKVAGERIVRAYAVIGKDYPKTDKGAPDLSREACETSGDPDLKRYSEYMSLGTKINKEIPALDHHQLHPYFDALIEHGGTSCSGPNTQNLPRKGGFRQCLIPRPGNLFVCGDYSGFHLSTMAQVCLDLLGESSLAKAINAGIDCHSEIAAVILGWPYERCTGVKKVGKSHPEFALFDNARQTGKVLNFGRQGGLGPGRLVHFAKQQYDVILTEDRAKHLIYDVWHPARPEMWRYFKLIESALDTHDAIEQLYSGRRRGKVTFSDACNGMFSGLANDIFKDVGFQVSRECYVGRLLGARIVNEVHDEYVLEAPRERAIEYAHTLKDMMITLARPWLPGVQLGAEVTVSERYKGDNICSI